MKKTDIVLLALALLLLLGGCEKSPEPPQGTTQNTTEKPADVAEAVDEPINVESGMSVGDVKENVSDIVAETEKAATELHDTTTETIGDAVSEVTEKEALAVSVISETEALSLAKKSGCLACHAIDKKMVGPAWKDVATRYKDDPEAKSSLLEKVSKGGKGNWDEMTGGVPMPPYSPRVSDDNIEKLVTFVLSL